MVAAACHALCEAANGLVQGHGSEAFKVKTDLTSQAMKRLQHAGKLS